MFLSSLESVFLSTSQPPLCASLSPEAIRSPWDETECELDGNPTTAMHTFSGVGIRFGFQLCEANNLEGTGDRFGDYLCVDFTNLSCVNSQTQNSPDLLPKSPNLRCEDAASLSSHSFLPLFGRKQHSRNRTRMAFSPSRMCTDFEILVTQV